MVAIIPTVINNITKNEYLPCSSGTGTFIPHSPPTKVGIEIKIAIEVSLLKVWFKSAVAIVS